LKKLRHPPLNQLLEVLLLPLLLPERETCKHLLLHPLLLEVLLLPLLLLLLLS
jgi:hypothetical protein